MPGILIGGFIGDLIGFGQISLIIEFTDLFGQIGDRIGDSIVDQGLAGTEGGISLMNGMTSVMIVITVNDRQYEMTEVVQKSNRP